MSGEKFRFRRGTVGQVVPLSERASSGEPYVDTDAGAIGVACGEQSPRWYPGVNKDGNLVLQEGQEIISSENPKTKISFKDGYFTVTVDGKEALRVSKDADSILDTLTLKDSLKFDKLQTVGFPDVPGFAYMDGKFTINCPLEILGSLNLSLSEFAQGIIPGGANVGDVFTAGDFPGDPYKWTSPSSIVTKLTKLAPLLYRASTRNSRSLDMSFGPYPILFGMNEDRKGALNDDLILFLNTFGGNFNRNTPGYCFDITGKLAQAGVNQPRIDFDPNTGRFLGILIEDATTNLHSNSNNMTNYTGTNMSATTIISPAWGSLNFRNPSSLSELGNGEHYMARSYNNRPLNVPVSYSAHVELPSDSATVRLLLSVGGNGNTFGAKFTLNKTSATTTANIVSGNATLFSTTIRRIKGNIYRIGVSGVLDPNSANLFSVSTRLQGLDGANNTSYNSSISGTAYVGEFQFETNKRVTSLIPTSSATASRDSDDLSLSFDGKFNFTAFKNYLGVKFISNKYVEGDPVFSLFVDDYRATLEAGANNTIRIAKGPVDQIITSNIGSIDNDFSTYEFDCTGQPLKSTLNIGASADLSKHFNGWVNLIYLYR